MFQIEEDLLPAGRNTNRPGMPIAVKGIISHRTGNARPTADARAHRRYFGGGYRGASAHYFVDSERILRLIPETEMAWHAGLITAAGWTRGNPNTWAIGVELCEDHPYLSPEGAEAYRRYVWLHADICRRHNLNPRQQIFGHHQVDPRNRPSDPVGLFEWVRFIDDVARALAADRPSQPPAVRPPQEDPAPAPVGTPILGPAQASVEQAEAWAKARGAHERFLAVLPIYWQEAPRYNTRPEVPASQAAKETRFGHYGGVVSPDAHNWCGLKTRAGGANDDPAAHARFPDDLTGVRAHLQHLVRYVGGQLPAGEAIVDPRYELVTPGVAPTVEALGGKWAPNPDYGVSIVRDYLAGMLATQAPSPPAWNPAAEIRRLRERGIIHQEHDPMVPPTWGELAAVANRVMDRVEAVRGE